MINSHYIPQFILKSFCNENNQIMYCDLEKHTIDARNVRTVFAEKGYYPDDLEYSLNADIEHDFSILYHNKIEKMGSSLVLSEDELFIIKKYLIVSAIRFEYEYSDSKNEFINKYGPAHINDLVNNLNQVLRAKNFKEYFQMLYNPKLVKTLDKVLKGEKTDETDSNVFLWAEVKDILDSYIIFVKAPIQEKFIIPDKSRGIYEGPISRKKLDATLQTLMTNPTFDIIAISNKISPRDYSVFPLSKDIAIVSMSSFYKLLTNSDVKANVILPDEYQTVSSILGFGSSNEIAPPKIRINRGKKEFRYTLTHLHANDVCHFNSIMMAEAHRHIAFSNKTDISELLGN